MTEPPPKNPRTWAVTASFALMLAGVWVAWAFNHHYWADRHAGTARHRYGACIRLCQIDLALRSAAVRRHAARTGRLPASLSECQTDAISLDAWAKTSRGSVGDPVLGNALSNFDWIVTEPWNDEIKKLESGSANIPRPAAELDFLGLPIVYQRGPRAGGGAWVSSADALPPEVMGYLAANGGVPAAAPEPFALGSLYVEDRLAYLASLDLKARVALVMLPAGVALIALAAFFVAIRLRLAAPNRNGIIGVVLVGMVSSATALGGYAMVTATCYETTLLTTSKSIPAAVRLELLDRAVAEGRVSEETARKARAYLEKL